MNDTAWITVTNQYDFRGGIERRDYRWEGDSPYTRVSWIKYHEDFGIEAPLEVGQRIVIGQFHLRVVENEEWYQRSLCIREDYWLWWLPFITRPISRFAEIVYRRFIITLAVWRLADYNEAVISTWHDIHALRWIAKRLGK
jgi:hypothetical protein